MQIAGQALALVVGPLLNGSSGPGSCEDSRNVDWGKVGFVVGLVEVGCWDRLCWVRLSRVRVSG